MTKSRPTCSGYFFRMLRPLATPLSFAIVSLVLLFGTSQAGGSLSMFGLSLDALITDAAYVLGLVALALLTIRLADLVVWHNLQRDLEHQVPKLLRDMVAALIWFGYFCVALISVFKQPLAPILTASTVMLGVIGFTLQRPIMDAFCGVIICLQKTFKEGDWIQIDETVGRVTQIDWRTVHLVTADEITIVLPNSQIAYQSVKIYTRPHFYFRDEIEITLPYSVTTQQGQRILLGAANQVEEIASLPRKSIVSIASYTDRGILWRLLYWCPDPGRIPVFRYLVHQNILRNLHYSDICVPVPMLDIRTFKTEPSTDTDDGIDKLMARIPLFAAMTADELRYLSSVARSHLFPSGKPMLHQGQDGDSLFILREGLLSVSIKQEDGTELNVGYIHPGQFFGEKSFLLGESRGATVTPVVDSMVSEVTKNSMANIIQKRPNIANYLSELLSERQLNRDAKLHSGQEQHEEDLNMITARLLNRIRSIFNLKSDPMP